MLRLRLHREGVLVGEMMSPDGMRIEAMNLVCRSHLARVQSTF